ncbi:MAG: glycine cleavage system protein GcvH [Planctomycetota bacterium]
MTDISSYRFSESHEWFSLQGDVVTMGITRHAADELTDITYVEVRDVGTSVSAGDTIGEVESVKTSSDIYSVVDGEIAEVNEAVAEDPALLNRDPHEQGWIARIKTSDTSPLDALMDAATYQEKFPIG